jgi:hypothetical protein
MATARSKLIYKSVLMYNQIMLISCQALELLLADAIDRDRTTARRATLCAILLHERYLTRQQLIVRVEGKLGAGCFGESAWVDTFYRDMQVVKKALRAAGYQPDLQPQLAAAWLLSSRPAFHKLRFIDDPGWQPSRKLIHPKLISLKVCPSGSAFYKAARSAIWLAR